MKHLLQAGTIAFALAAAVSARANLTFDFSFDFTSGPLLGQPVAISVETTDGDGLKNPIGGGLISLSALVDGILFTESDDLDYPDFPLVEVTGGGAALSFLGFLADTSDGLFEAYFDDDLGVKQVVFVNASGERSEFIRLEPAVPDNGGMPLLLAGGLAGLILARRARR